MSVPSDYCVLNGDPKARLSDVERLTLLGESGLDRIVARFAKQFASLSLGGLAPNLTIADLERALKENQEFKAPAAFVPPAKDPDATCIPIHGFEDGRVFDVSFASQSPIENHPVNNTVHVRLWEHSTPSRPTLVAIHGWSMGDQKVNSLAFLPGLFYSLGYNVAIIELPFHGKRATKIGEAPLFPNLNIPFTRSVLEQIVSDLRSTSRLLSARGHESIGCMGLSLGAYAGSLWASLDRLQFGVFIVPLASLGDLTWDLALSRFGKEPLEAAGINRARSRLLYYDASPLCRPSATGEEDLLIIAGRGDRIVPRHQVTLLKRRWPSANFHWLSGGHAAHFRKGRSLHIILEFLKKHELRGNEP